MLHFIGAQTIKNRFFIDTPLPTAKPKKFSSRNELDKKIFALSFHTNEEIKKHKLGSTLVCKNSNRNK